MDLNYALLKREAFSVPEIWKLVYKFGCMVGQGAFILSQRGCVRAQMPCDEHSYLEPI